MPKEKATRVARIHIYAVNINDEVKLVRTTSRARAIKHFTRDVKAEIPSVDQLVELVKSGVEVEDVEA